MKFHLRINEGRRNISFWIVIAGMLVFACQKEKRPVGVLSPEEMAKVMVDLYLAEARVSDVMIEKDSASKLFLPFEQKLLNRLNLSDSVVLLSYQYYIDHPDEFERIYDSVIDTLNLREQKIRTSETKK